jgi:hypothetical protein
MFRLKCDKHTRDAVALTVLPCCVRASRMRNNRILLRVAGKRKYLLKNLRLSSLKLFQLIVLEYSR